VSTPLERRKKSKRRVVTFDFDETITKAPKQLSHVAKALKDAGDTIIIVTGNQSKRSELEERLKDYGFPFDDLIQYEDDESDGLRRAAILEHLNAWLAFDDRAGRAVTYAKVCPHLFLSAEPSGEAEDNADGAKKAAKQDVKDGKRSTTEQPPNYKPATMPGVNCKTCIYDNDGHCRRYGEYPIQPDHVCDTWQAPGRLSSG
jgi:hypothetical protein